MTRAIRGRRPAVAESAYIDPSAQVIGDVTLGELTSVWPNVTIRADIASVTIGEGSNIQDNSCLHVDTDEPVVIGKYVVVGHSCTVHGCIIGDGCLIGMGAIILSGAKIGAGSIIGAGALVLEGQEIPPRSMVLGAPGKIRREISDEQLQAIRDNADRYVRLSREYLQEQ
ncbi:MAG: gamma carbonic anhydrase family protein [Bryobacterales bacterium]|nr:gamma carbonic anhydrase family protein [Acidobacteriota bacterium]MCB9384166.1 gamma carbonic anhydrase family protein [Bryobacterales bacterium]